MGTYVQFYVMLIVEPEKKSTSGKVWGGVKENSTLASDLWSLVISYATALFIELKLFSVFIVP